MKRTIAGALACAVTVFAGDAVRPRASSNDYPARQVLGDVVIGAAQVPAGQLGKTFPSALAKYYYVIEVGIFPNNGAAFDATPTAFTLRVGTSGDIHTATPEEVASLWRPKSDPPKAQSKVHVTNDTGVIYSTGRDPVTGQRRSGVGVYEGTGISTGPDPRGVPLPDAPGKADPGAVEDDLRRCELSERTTREPTAGYLYFAKPKRGSKDGKLELTYSKDGKTVVVKLP